ncbi:MAG: tetratricopeptide repeat protein [Pseudomonadota bacterium]
MKHSRNHGAHAQGQSNPLERQAKNKRTCLIYAALFSLGLSACASQNAYQKAAAAEGDLVQLNQAAQLAYDNDEEEKAEALYQELLKRMPNEAQIHLRLGNLYARNNRPDDAISAYQRALQLDNRETRAWYNLGVVRLRQAWAALLQAQIQQDPLAAKQGLSVQTEAMLKHLGKLPVLADELRHLDHKEDVVSY